jgi:hypothetical protein
MPFCARPCCVWREAVEVISETSAPPSPSEARKIHYGEAAPAPDPWRRHRRGVPPPWPMEDIAFTTPAVDYTEKNNS